jgi:hypothetical protein
MFSDEAAVALLAARSSAGIAPIVVVGSHEDMNVVSSLPEALVNTPWVGKRDTFVPLREATLEEGTLSVPYSRAQLQGAPMIDPDGALEDWEEARLQPLRDPLPPAGRPAHDQVLRPVPEPAALAPAPAGPVPHPARKTAMSHLVVLGLDNREDAEQVFDLTGDLARQQLLQLQDAAYAWRDDKGKVRIQQAINLTGTGAASGRCGAP